MSAHPPGVPTDDVRAHLQPMLDAGFEPRTIALAAGVAPQTVRHAVKGLRPSGRVKSGTGRLLLSLSWRDVYAAAPPGASVPAVGVARRVQALMTLGWSCQRIARACGALDSAVLTRVVAGTNTVVTAETWRRVSDFYDKHWNTPPEVDGRVPTGWLTKTLQRARQNRYAPPLAWDDDTIDDPSSKPDLGKGHNGTLHRDDLMWLIESGVRDWQLLEDRTGVERESLRRTLRERMGRSDIVDMIDLATYGWKLGHEHRRAS